MTPNCQRFLHLSTFFIMHSKLLNSDTPFFWPEAAASDAAAVSFLGFSRGFPFVGEESLLFSDTDTVVRTKTITEYL